MTPALTVFTEKIWGHAGNDFGIEVGAQTKQIGVGPDVGAVKIHKDRDVAHDANRMLSAIGSKRLPLFEEKKLHYAADFEIFEVPSFAARMPLMFHEMSFMGAAPPKCPG